MLNISSEDEIQIVDSAKEDNHKEYVLSTPKPRRLNMLIETKTPQIRIPPSPAMKRLGYGTGVGVYLMERSPNRSGEIRSPWAIKKISKIRKDNELIEKRLEYEAGILKGLSHPNIIGYRGHGDPATDIAYLAMEKAPKSLGDLIEERVGELTPIGTTVPFDAKYITKVALDVAKALQYLHDEKRIIHGDLKSGNVLIFGDFEIAKLCDFGVSRKIKEDGSLEGRYVGTEIWNPMEVILEKRGQKENEITSKADIYPYGLTLHEMMSLKPPHFGTAEDDYSGTGTNTNEDSTSEEFDEDAFEMALQRHLGKRPNLPDFDFDSSYNDILGVFYFCTEENPSDRPSATEILNMLENVGLAQA